MMCFLARRLVEVLLARGRKRCCFRSSNVWKLAWIMGSGRGRRCKQNHAYVESPSVPHGQHDTTQRTACISRFCPKATWRTQQYEKHVEVIPQDTHSHMLRRLGDQGRGGSGLVLEGRRELLLLDVVSSQSVDSGFDQNESAGGQRCQL